MDPSIVAAGISSLARIGGGFMSAQGASAANQQNAALNYANMDMQRDINTANQTFQNNVNVANWAFQDKVNQENRDEKRPTALHLEGDRPSEGNRRPRP